MPILMLSTLSPGPRIEYINDTPLVTGSVAETQFELNYCADPSLTMCRIDDVSSGVTGTQFSCELLYLVQPVVLCWLSNWGELIHQYIDVEEASLSV